VHRIAARLRLCTRYRQLIAWGKYATQVVVALTREMAAFVWALARTVAGTH
jgi:transposase